MERKIKNLELKKSGKFCFYLCEFLSAMSQSNRVPNSIFFDSFLVFAVNLGSGLAGLVEAEATCLRAVSLRRASVAISARRLYCLLI